MTISREAPIKNQVYDILKDSIIKGSLFPGQALSEKEYSDKLAVSRTPIREAFIRLAQEGLVEVYPQRGTFVSYISTKDVYEANFIRQALEVAVVKQVLQVIDELGLNELKQIVERQKHYRDRVDYERFYKEDESFHQTLSRISGFPNTWEVIKRLKLQMDRVRYLSLPVNSRVHSIIEQHLEIIQAIEAKDESWVEKATSQHMSAIMTEIQLLMEKYPEKFRG